MTVHMVRLFIEPPKGEADSAFDNWVANHNEWTDDAIEHTLTEARAGIDSDGTKHVRGNYRFIQDATVTRLLDDLERRLQSLQGGLWYRLGYHACDHDEENGSPCAWEQTRETGTVPSDIPKLS